MKLSDHLTNLGAFKRSDTQLCSFSLICHRHDSDPWRIYTKACMGGPWPLCLIKKLQRASHLAMDRSRKLKMPQLTTSATSAGGPVLPSPASPSASGVYSGTIFPALFTSTNAAHQKAPFSKALIASWRAAFPRFARMQASHIPGYEWCLDRQHNALT